MTRDQDIPPRAPTKLYLITPPTIETEAGFLETLEAVLATGAITALQIRLKQSDGTHPDLDAMASLARQAIPLAQTLGTAVFINDSAELAHETGADGVHLGQSDGTIKEARTLLGPDAIIGATCHDSRHLAMQAGEAGADYVAFGAFFPTQTKDAATVATSEVLTWWQALMELPCVAIGGITPGNAGPLIQAGADFLAVSSSVWSHADGPVAAISAFEAVLAKHFPAQAG